MQVLLPGLNLIRCPIRAESAIGSGIVPPISGDNYAFVDVDAPSGDGKFTLRDIAGGDLRYILAVYGEPGEEQAYIDTGSAWPDIASVDVTEWWQFGADNLFRILNITTF